MGTPVAGKAATLIARKTSFEHFLTFLKRFIAKASLIGPICLNTRHWGLLPCKVLLDNLTTVLLINATQL